MKKHLFCASLILMAIVSCKKQSVMDNAEERAQANGTTATDNLNFLPDYGPLCDILEKKLKDSGVIGYSFVVYKGNLKVASRADGFARLAQDPPSRAMSIDDKYSIASVSKTITAAALIKVLTTAPNTYSMIDQPMYPYLPEHWKIPANVKKITFRQLLDHTSGIRWVSSTTYSNLKQMVEADVLVANMGIYMYNNHNYGLMRLLIPRLAGYYIPKIYTGQPGLIDGVSEYTQGQICDDFYKDYCRKVVFQKVPGTANLFIDCKNTDNWPALYYARPSGGVKGFSQGDLSSVTGGDGWVLTTVQMADFFRTLHYSEKILPKNLSDAMKKELLGYDRIGTTQDGVSYFWKNGVYGISPTTAPAYRSLIIGFGDDLQISIMTNSGLVLQRVAIAAHEDWYGSRVNK